VNSGNGRAAIAPISHRERTAVATLVALGLSNAEIARHLGIDRGTVADHIEHALRRLRLRGRTQLAAWAGAHERIGVQLPPSSGEGAAGPARTAF
jgi:DNA-binding NarL/FixJ family response regulator